jgi:hypothetical protein
MEWLGHSPTDFVGRLKPSTESRTFTLIIWIYLVHGSKFGFGRMEFWVRANTEFSISRMWKLTGELTLEPDRHVACSPLWTIPSHVMSAFRAKTRIWSDQIEKSSLVPNDSLISILLFFIFLIECILLLDRIDPGLIVLSSLCLFQPYPHKLQVAHTGKCIEAV